MSDPTSSPPSFEASVRRLEALVERLDSDELGLDEALAVYEEGMGLARACAERLRAAELRVQELALEG